MANRMPDRRRPRRRRIRRLIGACTLVLFACTQDAAYTQFSAPWIRFIGGLGIAGAFDSAHLVVRGDTVDVWLRFQYARPQVVGNDSAGAFSAMETQEAVDCAAQRVRDIRMLVRNAAGDSTGGYVSSAAPWQTFAEHPISDHVLTELCRALADWKALR